MGMPLNKAYRMSLPLVSDGRVTQSLWQHHTEPLTERNKQRYQNRGKNVILLKIFPRGGMTVSTRAVDTFLCSEIFLELYRVEDNYRSAMLISRKGFTNPTA